MQQSNSSSAGTPQIGSGSSIEDYIKTQVRGLTFLTHSQFVSKTKMLIISSTDLATVNWCGAESI